MRFRRAVVSLISFVLISTAVPTFAAAPAGKKDQPAPTSASSADKVPPEAAKLIEEAIAKGHAQKFPEAVDLLLQAVSIIEKKLGKDHYLLGNSLNLLAQLEMLLGHLDVAEKHADRSIAVLKKDVNADPLRLGHALIRRAELHERRDEFDKEIELRKLALLLFEKAFGVESPDAMAEVRGLSAALRRVARYAEARTYIERWIRFIEGKFGPNEPVLVEGLLDLSVIETELGRFAEAEKILLRALEIRKFHGRRRDEDLEDILNNLAEVKYQQGDYVAAEALFERVLRVFESKPSVHYTAVGVISGNLGSLRIDRGDYQGGLPLLERSLNIKENSSGSNHSARATP